jgi:hypothetical protein
MNENKSCHCGAPDCWDKNDYSWLSSNSGWHGDINGCQSSVFFIHGKKIREQRHIPTGYFPVDEIPALFAKWSQGLPGARLTYSHDTGGGDWGLWIEGERDPNGEDWARLEAARERDKEKARREIAYAIQRFPELRTDRPSA